MSFRLVENQWHREFTDAAEGLRHELRIMTPFLQLKAAKQLITKKLRSISVITRFNINDFSQKVSSIEALKWLLAQGAEIRGVKNLHAKAYIFDDARSIVTSANLTTAALVTNHELGFVTTDSPLVAQCSAYFDQMWKKAKNHQLKPALLEMIEKKLKLSRHANRKTPTRFNCGDLGARVGLPTPPLPRAKPVRTKSTPRKVAKGTARSGQTKKNPKKAKGAFMGPVQPDALVAAVVGSKPLKRTELTKKLWAYIKRNGLQDKKFRTMINADDALQAVFGGKKRASMFQMTKFVSMHVRAV